MFLEPTLATREKSKLEVLQNHWKNFLEKISTLEDEEKIGLIDDYRRGVLIKGVFLQEALFIGVYKYGANFLLDEYKQSEFPLNDPVEGSVIVVAEDKDPAMDEAFEFVKNYLYDCPNLT